ncbi:PilZ domain-containing protein [Thalassotalea mangrovi]|uniref:PilZ domain-containing protein n=1 Tax=Thalassotalea mangrovi TaxID=2572245 RepID=A0A4U1B474_9GAMM|nr:PilZ domain-containing protein [Thalassotalea mangrovi]TKB44760.1 PilZ domain-containing protein [Thalassotalea mangrovi]
MTQQSEKRAYFRNYLNQPLQLLIAEQEDEEVVNGTCIDVSDGGIAVELSHPIALGTHVKIQNNYEVHGELAVCLQHGTVIRCQQQADDRYLLALHFQTTNGESI